MVSVLPPELWLQIFYWATDNFFRGNINIRLFEEPSILSVHDRMLRQRSLDVKRAIALVCSQWHTLVAELLYEFIPVRCGSDLLTEVLELSKSTSAPNPGVGKYVQSVFLPVLSDRRDDAAVRRAPCLIFCCPNIQTLACVYGGSREENNFPFLKLLDASSLRRFDWENITFYADPKATVPLPSCLWQACNLQVLTIRGHVPHLPDAPPLDLPALHTLRLSTELGSGKGCFKDLLLHSHLPSLRRLILERLPAPSTQQALWAVYGAALRTLELGQDLKFGYEDHGSSILHSCAHLQALNFYVFNVHPILDCRHTTITEVGLHAARNAMNFEQRYGANWRWTRLGQHFAWLRDRCPALECVKLYGNWSEIMADSRFEPLRRSLQTRGITLVTEDGEVVKGGRNAGAASFRWAFRWLV